MSDGFATAHVSNMCGANIRDHTDVSRRDLSQGSGLAGVIHADLPDAEVVLWIRAQNGQREADVVVQIPQGSGDPKLAPQDGADHVLGRGLAIAARDDHGLGRQESAVSFGKLL